MGDIMRQVPFEELLKRIFSEYKVSNSIFEISQINFFHKTNKNRSEVFGEHCDTPVGPAAGPHTQLAQNIISSYLTGGRFIELKTVQIIDTLEIEKPCIDADDEAFNTEWSSEFTLEKAYDEYIKAWILLHLIELLFGFKVGKERSFIFNMSVGYDLKGIKSPKMDRFIMDMIDSSSNVVFKNYLTALDRIIEESSFLNGTGIESKIESLKGLSKKIPTQICKSLTLSTMHGCPPKEIEAICEYMITQKGLNTFVKLNPTLLGFNMVRDILDNLGFNYIEMKEESFDNDLQFNDAIKMLRRLMKLAVENNIKFGVKLTNTLGIINNKQMLPGSEMYMSGRALYPLSINLASLLAEEFNGNIPISYSGGASSINIKQIFKTGIHPITMATDLLKPGGYVRMKESAMELETSTDSSDWNRTSINVPLLKQLAKDCLTESHLKKQWRGDDKISVNKPLPLFDCYIAPCIYACPIHQDIPEYIKLVGEKKYKEAIELIYTKNALPSITGYICDHQCMYNCTRLDYEGAVQIREMKKIAVENGFSEFKDGWIKPKLDKNIKVAVIGAGPAGLSAAFFLARNGFLVTVFEKEQSAGGVVNNIIPNFRIPKDAVERDINFIKAHGVKFEYGVDSSLSIKSLKTDGFKYICIGIGAEKGNYLNIENDNNNILESLEFLGQFNKNPDSLKIGKNVAVIGGGNTAMDSARAALKLKDTQSVIVIYRRTQKEMPADREEYEEALEDGVEFHFLRNPIKFKEDLTCSVMKLGEPDSSGRRRPIATVSTQTFKIDTVITAIGEHVDTEVIESLGLPLGNKGKTDIDNKTNETTINNVFLIGDSRTGPSTIVECIADARLTADTIIDREHGYSHADVTVKFETDTTAILGRKGKLNNSLDLDEITAFAKNEASRCLECNYICNKCVDVCPNRANIAIPCNGENFTNNFNDPFQIVHIDAYCNECGNCGTFCPYDGLPYKDKLTIFNLKEDFQNSENSGFLIDNRQIKLRLAGKIYNLELTEDNRIKNIDSKDKSVINAISVIDIIITKHNYLLGPVIA
ncbi:MAG: putative selenate reductase subunit YgfK [Spirochaetaceae bacterium]